MNVLAADLTEDLTYRDTLRLLQVTAQRFHVMADAVEEDLEGDESNDGRGS